MSEYSAVPSTGKLKLKGVKAGRVEKSKKKAKKLESGIGGDGNNETASRDNSIVLGKLQEDDDDDNDRSDRTEKVGGDDGDAGEDADANAHREHSIRRSIDTKGPNKTEAERRYDEQRKKRLKERLEKEGVKTHKERVEELNKYLSNLSEHHDMPKIGPG